MYQTNPPRIELYFYANNFFEMATGHVSENALLCLSAPLGGTIFIVPDYDTLILKSSFHGNQGVMRGREYVGW